MAALRFLTLPVGLDLLFASTDFIELVRDSVSAFWFTVALDVSFLFCFETVLSLFGEIIAVAAGISITAGARGRREEGVFCTNCEEGD